MTTKNRKTTPAVPAQNADTIPLNLLIPDPKNVRRFESEAGITDLCAQIVSQGLLQNLNVRPADENGKFYVTAGSRRLRALRELSKRKAVIEPTGEVITKDYPVRVNRLTEQHRPVEVSLIENIGRSQMHAADEIVAFDTLRREENLTPEQIGDRFGISHMTVRRRLKLASVSPRLIDEFRQGGVSLQQLEAVALTDDHERQEAIIANLPTWNRSADAIRSQLTNDKIAATHRYVTFVGIEAYEAAGGPVTRDLFAEEGRGVFLDDKALIVRLACEKLQQEADTVREAEGWRWAESYLNESEARRTSRIASYRREPTEAERAEVDEIDAFLEANDAAYQADEMTDEEAAEVEAQNERRDEIEAGLIGYDEDEKVLAGVRAFLAYDGTVTIQRGLVLPEQEAELTALRRKEAEAPADGESFEDGDHDGDGETGDHRDQEPEEPAGPAYSAALTGDLTTNRTTALAYEVSQRPDVALALAVHALGNRVFYADGYYYGVGGTCVSMSVTEASHTASVADPDNTSAKTALDEAFTALQQPLPKERGEFLGYCLDADRKTLLALLAMIVGRAVHARVDNPTGRNRNADDLAALVGLDMANWWKPSEAFLKRISKAQIAAATTEAGCAPEVSKAILGVTKAEAIETALEHLDGKRWVPAMLRTPKAAAPAGDDAEPVEPTGEGEAEAVEDAGDPPAFSVAAE